MSLPYFYEPFIAMPYHILSKETSRHCIQVLRVKQDALLNLTNGKGNIYEAVIIKADREACEVKINEQRTVNYKSKPDPVSIAISILKNPVRLEWFMEKATEIGVSEIFPLICTHTEKENFRYDRMNNILISAMLQSRQTWLPRLHQPKKFTEFIDDVFYETKLIAHCTDMNKILLKDVKHDKPALILIGPEGDFSQTEIDMALQKNFVPVSLGNTRLRAETAGIVAAALLCNS